MARLPDLREFCDKHGLKMCTIADLIEYRRRREKLVKREIALKLPTDFGVFDLFAYSSMVDQEPHLALTLGGIGVETAPGVVPVQERAGARADAQRVPDGRRAALREVRLRAATGTTR